MKNIILWVLTVLPTLITTITIQFMEDKIPAHYDIMGNIDRWGSKYESFFLPAIIIISTIIWSLVMKSYRKKQMTSTDEKVIIEARQNEKVLYYVAVGMAVLFSIMQYFIMYSAIVESKNNMQTMHIDINVVTNVVLGMFMIAIGNILPKCKYNYIVGVRTAWSMKNDVTWAKSNRFGGISSVISGFLIIIETIIFKGFVSTLIMLAIIILDGIITCVYSYKVYMIEKNN